MPPPARQSALNRNFRVTVEATSSVIEPPISANPLYFTRNPTKYQNGEASRGLSIGHKASAATLEVRMSDGANHKKIFGPDNRYGELGAGPTFTYFNGPRVDQKSTVHLTCVFTGKARICSVEQNGKPASPASLEIPAAGDIYEGDGGMFGVVWGWRFIGTLHGIRVAEPGAACIFYGGKAVTDVARMVYEKDSVLKFDCPTTTSTTTTTISTTTTATTNTILDALAGKMSEVEKLIEGQVQQQQKKTAALEQELEAVRKESQDTIGALQQQVGVLYCSGQPVQRCPIALYSPMPPCKKGR